jgi:hypothetical protein
MRVMVRRGLAGLGRAGLGVAGHGKARACIGKREIGYSGLLFLCKFSLIMVDIPLNQS